jgi:hypothetical protein
MWGCVGEASAASTTVDATEMGFFSGRMWREHLKRGAVDVKKDRVPTSTGYVDNFLSGRALRWSWAQRGCVLFGLVRHGCAGRGYRLRGR